MTGCCVAWPQAVYRTLVLVYLFHTTYAPHCKFCLWLCAGLSAITLVEKCSRLHMALCISRQRQAHGLVLCHELYDLTCLKPEKVRTVHNWGLAVKKHAIPSVTVWRVFHSWVCEHNSTNRAGCRYTRCANNATLQLEDLSAP